MGANLVENAAPEIGEVPEIGRENLNTFWFWNQLECGKEETKRWTRKTISWKSSLKISRSRKDIFEKIKWV